MKLLGSFLAATLALSASTLAATSSVFEKYHTKALSSTPVIIADPQFEELITLPRDYGFVVCLTALDARFGCKMCQDFQPEWSLLGKSWLNGDKKGDGRLLFGTLDFAEGKKAFQMLRLETAPIIIYFPPTTGPNAAGPNAEPPRFEFTAAGITAEQVHAWLSRQLPESDPKPPVARPIQWLLIIGVTTGVLGGLTVLTVAWPYVLPLVQNRNLWATGCLIAILLFTSGHMYNHIRGAPYVGGGASGGPVQYFAPGFQNQFGLESQIIAAIYAFLSFATIALALKVPRMSDPKSQQAAVFIWGAVIYGVYSFLLSVFRIKNQGYPFFLPPL